MRSLCSSLIGLSVAYLATGCVVFNLNVNDKHVGTAVVTSDSDDDSSNSTTKDAGKDKQKKPKKEMGWLVAPGFYESYDKNARGFETSILYNQTGASIGFERSKFKYIEAEIVSVLALGVGLRRTDAGKIAYQATWSAPIFFVFPYGRKIWEDPERSYEVGLMLKVPLYDPRVHVDSDS